MRDVPISWFGPTWSYSGYATHNRYMVLGLSDLGWKIELKPSEKNIPSILHRREDLIRLTKNRIGKDSPRIGFNLIPPAILPEYGDYTILFTTLESRTVHWGYEMRCRIYDEIWVPCKDNAKALVIHTDLKKPILVIPEGVDVDLYRPGDKVLPELQNDDFKFLYTGDWSYRKGVQWLVKAYHEEFSPDEAVRLVISSHYGGDDTPTNKARLLKEYEEILNKNKITRPAKADFILDWVPDDILGRLYNGIDCFVIASCGEAWALPVIQSMACGKAVLVSKWGGQRDYCTRKNAYFFDVEKFDTMHDKVELAVDFYWYQEFAFPSVESIRERMRYIFEHQKEAKAVGIRALLDVRRNWTWGKAVEKADRRLLKIEKIIKKKRGIKT